MTIYKKYDSLYKIMRESRWQYDMSEIQYYDKLEYYRKMALEYKNKAGACRRYSNLKNKDR